MSEETKIQWCDSTVNPIMGCAGCELFPSPKKVLDPLDRAIAEATDGWKIGNAKRTFQALVDEAHAAIDEPLEGHNRAVTTTNIWHLRERFLELLREKHGRDAAGAAEAVIEREITCYAAKQHLNRGLSLLKPKRKANSGYAPTFERIHGDKFTGTGYLSIHGDRLSVIRAGAERVRCGRLTGMGCVRVLRDLWDKVLQPTRATRGI